ncbi:hypothetical protein [uncultured Algibacter sp.]|uniref:hypothetical protein n=1 Tax=uncultured Algibacter sp. TaxID=298659 RepID=UPI0032168EC4
MQELDFLFKNEADWAATIFLAVFSMGIALFYTLLMYAFYNENFKPKWLFFVVNPSLIIITKLIASHTVFFVFGCLFVLTFLLFFVGAIYKGIKTSIKSIKKRSKKEKASSIAYSIIKNILIVLLAIIGMFLMGPYMFIFIFIYAGFSGFKKFNAKNNFLNIQANTPTSKIASMAMGIVELVGHVEMQEPLITRIGKKPCIGYRYKIERRHRNSDGKDSYSIITDEVTCNPFILEDSTGRVQVNPEDIQFEWVEEDDSYSSSGKRYTQYVLYDNDNILLIGKANSKGNQVFIENDAIRNVFALAPFSKITMWNRYKPLLNSFLSFMAILVICIGFILIMDVELVENTLKFSFNLSWDNFKLNSLFN